nr:hydroxyacid dehydrogenase [uncultured Actinotalea sp.]
MSRPTAALVMRPGLPGDLFDDDALARLRAATALVDVAPTTSWERARADGWLDRVEVLVTGWGAPRVDEAVLADAPALRAVVHSAGSVKELLVPAVWERGVVVATAAEANSVPVAEFTLGVVLLSLKRAWLASARACGRLDGPVPTQARGPETVGAYGRTVGVVGASRIGRRVLDLLRPFDVDVLLHDPYVAPDEARALGAEPVELDTLVARSDVVTLHAPSVPATRHLLDARRLALMADGATLVNTARGALVDHDALTREVLAGRLHAVLDVTDPEPLPAGHPLLAAPTAFVTPHVAGALGTELRRLGAWSVAEVERFVAGRSFAAPVALADLDRIA